MTTASPSIVKLLALIRSAGATCSIILSSLWRCSSTRPPCCCCWQRRGHGRKRKAACRKAVERAKACVGMTRRPENAWARLPDRDLGHPGNRGTSDERRTIDADLGPVKYLATLRPSRRGSAAVVHLDRCGAARSGRGALTLGSDADTSVSGKPQGGVRRS